jgi:hypothetical protein
MRAETERKKRTRSREATAVIRPYTPADREAVREISRKTAYRNRGSSTVFEDGELFADYWTRYYTDFEPESCLILEEDGRVIGYLLGTVDARRHQSVMARKIVPGVLARAFWRLATFRYRQPSTRRMLWWLVSRGWQEEPHIPHDKYPAHYHCNILREGYGKGYYSAMALKFLDRLDELGVGGLHGQVEEAESGGPWRQMVSGYEELQGRFLDHFAEKPSTFQNYVLGSDKRLVNRAFGATVSDYRGWLVWASKKYHM